MPDPGTHATYPAHRQADVVLRDGSTVHVRPVRPGDREALKRFLERLSPDSLGLRFFSLGVNLDGAAKWAADVDYDRHFGPVIACGAGGVTAKVMKDIAVRITPLTDRDVHAMVTSLRSFPLLEGFRGGPQADVAALEEVLLRVGAMVEAHPEVAEMDCNPVVVSPEGAVIVDARVRVEAVAPAGPSPTV